MSIIAENSVPETTPDITEMETSPAQKTGEQRDVLDDEELDKLHPAQLNKLYYETVSAMKELDMDIYRAKDLENFMPPRTYTIWEVSAGEGKVTKTANRRVNCTATRFSREDGWTSHKHLIDEHSSRSRKMRSLTRSSTVPCASCGRKCRSSIRQRVPFTPPIWR